MSPGFCCSLDYWPLTVFILEATWVHSFRRLGESVSQTALNCKSSFPLLHYPLCGISDVAFTSKKVLCWADFPFPKVHIQTIGILVSEKSELQTALGHTQQAARQKSGNGLWALRLRLLVKLWIWSHGCDSCWQPAHNTHRLPAEQHLALSLLLSSSLPPNGSMMIPWPLRFFVHH